MNILKWRSSVWGEALSGEGPATSQNILKAKSGKARSWAEVPSVLQCNGKWIQYATAPTHDAMDESAAVTLAATVLVMVLAI
eukprot:scaffold995_cov244-Pinguiococcus_pyrenoidosus.AAC.18